jgi:hypothetical protein
MPVFYRLPEVLIRKVWPIAGNQPAKVKKPASLIAKAPVLKDQGLFISFQIVF